MALFVKSIAHKEKYLEHRVGLKILKHGVPMSNGRLAIIGARGIGHHGGFETVVAELAPRLNDGGSEVYCSARSSDASSENASFKGVHVMQFPFVFPKTYSIGKIFEVLYDSYFVVKAKYKLKCDTVYCLGVAAGLSLLLTKWSRSTSAVNVDGLEWTRDKFGFVTRLFLRVSFLACCVGCDRIVLDNRALIDHVPKRFRKKAVCIAYGVTPINCGEGAEIASVVGVKEKTVLEDGRYWLVVARLEPENNIHRIIGAYLSSSTTLPLIIVGDCSSQRYEEALSALADRVAPDKKIIMAGSIYDKERLNALRCGCAAYIHGHSVGGTNPSLLEAMSAGNIVICHDNAFNREVSSDSALYFSDEPSLAEIMNQIESTPSRFSGLGKGAMQRVERFYRWEDVVTEHEKLFSELRGR